MRIKNEGVEKRCRCRKGVIRPFYFLHLLSIFSAFAAPAAVPLTWQVDTTRVAPVTFDAYHGETLALEAVFKDASRPLDLTGKTANLYWQTNGMENVYWATNATVSATNHIAATFTGAMDPGAASVRGFLGIAGENYRASFVIRFRPSPGFDPATLPLPTRTLDFATTEVRNAPYWTKAESDARYSGGGGGVSTNAVSGIITNHVTSGYLCTVAEAQAKANDAEDAAIADAAGKYLPAMKNSYGQFIIDKVVDFNNEVAINSAMFSGYTVFETWHSIYGETISLPDYLDSLAWRTTGNRTLANYGITNAYTKAEADDRYVPNGGSAYFSVFNGQVFVNEDYGGVLCVSEDGFPSLGLSQDGTDIKEVGVSADGGAFEFRNGGSTSALTADGSPVLTRDAADARFAPTNVAVAVASKQDRLVSGTNIKTVNGNSLLGAGNIEIQGGGGGIPEKYKVVTIPDNDWEYSPSFAGNTMIEEVYASGWNNPFGSANGFANCLGLRRVKYNGTIPSNGKFNNLGERCFANCTNLVEVDFGGAVFNSKKFGNFMFSNCYKLGRVEFPEGVIGHNNQLFCNCPARIDNLPNSCLTNVVFPATWTTYDNYVFRLAKDNGVDYTFKADVSQITITTYTFGFMNFRNSTARFPNNTQAEVLAAFTTGTSAQVWQAKWYASGFNNTFVCSDGSFTTP